MMKRLGIGAVCLAVGAIIGLLFVPIVEGFQAQRVYRDHVTTLRSRVGTPAPEVTGPTLDGMEWSLVENHGKVVVLDFWATWCAPCLADMPKLASVARRYASRDDFALIGVNMDFEPEIARRFVNEHELPWLHIYENWNDHATGIRHAFGIEFLPSIWVIDQEGRILAAHITADELSDLLDGALADPAYAIGSQSAPG